MDYLQLIKDKQDELQPMFSRMDADREVFLAAPYVMRDRRGRKMPDVYHVTLLDAPMFAKKAVDRIISVSRQTLVEPASSGRAVSDRRAAVVESFLDDLQLEIDARLACRGELDAFSQHAFFTCYRGPCVEQVLLRLDNGELVPDSRPIDPRYFTYEQSDDGLTWGCVETVRGKAAIKAEYGVEVAGRTAVVLDFWNDELEVVFVDGKKVAENANPYGYAPFVISFPASTIPLKDQGSIKYKGDSILHTLRDDAGHYLFEEKNYIASILKTLAMENLKPAQQLPASEAAEYQPLPENGYPAPGEVIQVKSPMLPVQKGDVKGATLKYYDMVETQLRQSTYSSLDYGTIDMPLSAVAMVQVQSGKNEMLLPRLNNVASLTAQAGRMKLRQVLQMGRSVRLGEEGHKRTYKPSELRGEYVLKYRFFTSSLEQTASQAAIANAMGDLVSRQFKQEHILRLQDPARVQAEIDDETTRQLDPVSDLMQRVYALISRREEAAETAEKDLLDARARSLLQMAVGIARQRASAVREPQSVDIQQDVRQAAASSPPRSGVMPVFAQG